MNARTRTVTENVRPHVARTGRETKDTALAAAESLISLSDELHRLRRCPRQDTKWLTPAAPSPQKSPWFELKWRKNPVQRDKCPHQFPSNLMDVSKGATARSFAITHASFLYHSQHLPAWQMSACHSLTRLCSACVCVMCAAVMWVSKRASRGHWDIWVWDGLKRWCGGSRIARGERTATVKRLPLPVLVKAIQSIILLSTPHPLTQLSFRCEECDGCTPLSVYSNPMKVAVLGRKA